MFNLKVSACVRTLSAFTDNWSPHTSQCAWVLGYNPGFSSLCINIICCIETRSGNLCKTCIYFSNCFSSILCLFPSSQGPSRFCWTYSRKQFAYASANRMTLKRKSCNLILSDKCWENLWSAGITKNVLGGCYNLTLIKVTLNKSSNLPVWRDAFLSHPPAKFWQAFCII